MFEIKVGAESSDDKGITYLNNRSSKLTHQNNHLSNTYAFYCSKLLYIYVDADFISNVWLGIPSNLVLVQGWI